MPPTSEVKGGSPLSRMYRITPTDHMSTAEVCFSPRRAYGGMWMRVGSQVGSQLGSQVGSQVGNGRGSTEVR